MTVSDTQVAILRAFLVGGESGYDAERALLDRQAADSLTYGALLAAAFSEAVTRRFATQTNSWRVVRYVADVRSRSARSANVINPRIAERLILEALGEGTTADVNGKKSSWIKLVLLTALMEEASLDKAQLDEFIAKVTKMADRILGNPLTHVGTAHREWPVNLWPLGKLMDTLVIPHPIVGLMPGCPLLHLAVYGLSSYTCSVLERELGAAGTVGDLTRFMESRGLMELCGIGPIRAAELECVLTNGGIKIVY